MKSKIIRSAFLTITLIQHTLSDIEVHQHAVYSGHIIQNIKVHSTVMCDSAIQIGFMGANAYSEIDNTYDYTCILLSVKGVPKDVPATEKGIPITFRGKSSSCHLPAPCSPTCCGNAQCVPVLEYSPICNSTSDYLNGIILEGKKLGPPTVKSNHAACQQHCAATKYCHSASFHSWDRTCQLMAIVTGLSYVYDVYSVSVIRHWAYWCVSRPFNSSFTNIKVCEYNVSTFFLASKKLLFYIAPHTLCSICYWQ